MKNASLLFRAVALAAALGGLGACSTVTVNVPLSYAKLDTGYVNSSFYELGNVFVWDTKNRVLYDEGHLSVPKEMRDVGSTVAVQQASLSRDTQIEATADIKKYVANGQLAAAVTHSTSTELNHVNRQTTDALGLVNYDNDLTRAWRQRMAVKYSGSAYEFYVVDRVISGSKITVSSNATKGAGAGGNVVSVGGNVKVNVKYDSKDVYTESAEAGQEIPLVIRGTLLRLDGSGSDLAFVPASASAAKAFNLQRAINTMP